MFPPFNSEPLEATRVGRQKNTEQNSCRSAIQKNFKNFSEDFTNIDKVMIGYDLNHENNVWLSADK